MTREDAIIRLVGDLKKHHERALAKHETQMLLKDGYCRKLEDLADIAVEMLAAFTGCSKDDAGKLIADAYEVRQLARKVAS